MIDTVELLFAHHGEELAVQGPGGGFIMPKGFFGSGSKVTLCL